MKAPLAATLAWSVIASAQAALISINFATTEQSEATGPYTSSRLGLTVTEWDYDGGPNGNDWSGNGTTFSADGATIGIWHDAPNTWRNVTQPESSVLHGYLDDGLGTGEQRYIHLTGLATWLSTTGDTSYRVVVLRSTDNGTGFGAIDVTTGDVSGETGWLNNSTPTGGNTQFLDNAIPASPLLSASNAAITYETEIFVSDANGLSLYYGDQSGGAGGRPRGPVAGILIESIPEPSVALLAGLGGLALIRRRR